MRDLADEIQKRIEWLYDVKSNSNAKYSITNKTEGSSSYRKVPESKLENLVYIHPKVIKNLNENNPFKSLNEKNIPDFLVLIKEIDRWVYLNTKFELGKIPSKFELELQTTVTGCWIAAGFMSNHKDRMATRFMLDYNNLGKDSINFLMENVFPQGHLKLDKNIDIYKLIKGKNYPVADLLARDYCKYLTRKGIDTILFSLRKFYRMDGEEKVCYVMKDFKNNPTL